MGAQIVTILLLFLCHLQLCQSQTAGDIGPNFCLLMEGVEDNLSCLDEAGQSQCFNRSLLCNGVNDCASGADEGTLSALNVSKQWYHTL
jgi:hypothetical protein